MYQSRRCSPRAGCDVDADAGNSLDFPPPRARWSDKGVREPLNKSPMERVCREMRMMARRATKVVASSTMPRSPAPPAPHFAQTQRDGAFRDAWREATRSRYREYRQADATMPGARKAAVAPTVDLFRGSLGPPTSFRIPFETMRWSTRSGMVAAFAAVLLLLLPACGGSSSPRSGASAGQQLKSLREAYDSGAITREEYEQERRRILGDR